MARGRAASALAHACHGGLLPAPKHVEITGLQEIIALTPAPHPGANRPADDLAILNYEQVQDLGRTSSQLAVFDVDARVDRDPISTTGSPGSRGPQPEVFDRPTEAAARSR